MMRAARLSPLLCATLGLGLIALSPAAQADDDPGGIALGLEIGPNFVPEDVDDSVGVGVSVRGGYRLANDVVFITPEAKVGFESPGTPDAVRIMGGVRAGLATPIAPVVFGHLGGLVGDLEGFAWDVGGGLDLNVGPLLVGAFVSYNRAEDQQLSLDALSDDSAAYEWVQVGASVGVVF